MKYVAISIGLGLLAVSGVASAQPALKIFAGFEPGRYSVAPADANAQTRGEALTNSCVISPEALIHAGFEAANGRDCMHTVIENTTESATVAYSCRGLGSGRTTVILDNKNHYTLDAQGIQGRLPFALRREYKRIGACN